MDLKIIQPYIIGGDNIYGAGLYDTCLALYVPEVRSYSVANSIFKFLTPTLSNVSSSAKRVCLCENGIPRCADMDYLFRYFSVTPGERFNLSVVLVANDFGTLTGGVFAAGSSDGFSFSAGQTLQQITSKNSCSNLEYSIHSTMYSGNVSFILSINSIAASFQQAKLKSTFNPDALHTSVRSFQSNSLSSSVCSSAGYCIIASMSSRFRCESV